MSPICKQCGQPIWGNYTTALGASWHPEHLLCAGCHRPVGNGQFMLHEGAIYHPACYSQYVAPRCVYCGKPLDGEYLVDHWGAKYCKEHQGQYPSCAFCGRLVSPTQQKAGAETISCPICRSTAIASEVEARPLFPQVIRWVGAQGLKYNNLPISLELCNRARLAQLLQERNQVHSLGATTSTSYSENGRLVRTEVTGVAVLQDLPTTLFQGVTVHELGHVWLIVQGIRGLPSWAEEGFCELLSHRYYSELNTPESRYHAQGIEQNRNKIYGDGFRQIRALADAQGFARFIEILRTTRRLP